MGGHWTSQPPKNTSERQMRANWTAFAQQMREGGEGRGLTEKVGELRILWSWGNYAGTALFTFPSPWIAGGRSIQVLWPTCKAAVAHPQPPFPELDPAGTGGHQSMHTRGPSTQNWSSGYNRVLLHTSTGYAHMGASLAWRECGASKTLRHLPSGLPCAEKLLGCLVGRKIKACKTCTQLPPSSE